MEEQFNIHEEMGRYYNLIMSAEGCETEKDREEYVPKINVQENIIYKAFTALQAANGTLTIERNKHAKDAIDWHKAMKQLVGGDGIEAVTEAILRLKETKHTMTISSADTIKENPFGVQVIPEQPRTYKVSEIRGNLYMAECKDVDEMNRICALWGFKKGEEPREYFDYFDLHDGSTHGGDVYLHSYKIIDSTQVIADGTEQSTVIEPKIKNVFLDKESGCKEMVWNEADIQKIKGNPTQYEFVCEKPHQDGSYSYLCGSDWCRCCQ